MTGKRTSALLPAAVALLGLAACSADQGRRGEPGMSWESMASLPDFGGWWEWQYSDEYRFTTPDGTFILPPNPFRQAPVRPEFIRQGMQVLDTLGARIGAGGSQTAAEILDDVTTICQPPGFAGANGTFATNFEILFTPGRVTITDEGGLIRRVMLGQQLPEDPEESYAGTSVGHWEGDTLVVETTGIDPTVRFISFPIGKGARMTERFRLAEPDVLEVQLEMTAPGVLEDVFRHTFRYRRNRDYVFHAETACHLDDRSVDHERRTQRFDLTPPEDLPPPPGS